MDSQCYLLLAMMYDDTHKYCQPGQLTSALASRDFIRIHYISLIDGTIAHVVELNSNTHFLLGD